MLLPMNTPFGAAQFHRPAQPHTAPDQIAWSASPPAPHPGHAAPAAATILDASATSSPTAQRHRRQHQHRRRLRSPTACSSRLLRFRKRVWLLSDGQPNEEENEIFPQVNALRASWTNLNTIASAMTLTKTSSQDGRRHHNGHFFKVSDVATLSAAFAGSASARTPSPPSRDDRLCH